MRARIADDVQRHTIVTHHDRAGRKGIRQNGSGRGVDRQFACYPARAIVPDLENVGRRRSGSCN